MAILMSPEQYYLRTEEGKAKLQETRRQMLRLVREHLSKHRFDILNAVNAILAFTTTMNPLGCKPAPRNGRLRFHTNDVRIVDVTIPRAVTMLRMMCARLSVVAGETTQTNVSPYGAAIEFPYDRGDGKANMIKLDFANTPGKQEFDLWARGEAGSQ